MDGGARRRSATSTGNRSHGTNPAWRLRLRRVEGRSPAPARPRLQGSDPAPALEPGGVEASAAQRDSEPPRPPHPDRAPPGRPNMKVLSVRANNRKKCFEVRTRQRSYTFPYSATDTPPTARDRIVRL